MCDNTIDNKLSTDNLNRGLNKNNQKETVHSFTFFKKYSQQKTQYVKSLFQHYIHFKHGNAAEQQVFI